MTAKVIVRGDKGYKFVVLETENGEIVVFADEKYGYHRNLLACYCKENGLHAKCLGGGQIRIDREKKIIRIRDSSGDFGMEPNRKETGRLIQEAFPDFTVKVSA